MGKTSETKAEKFVRLKNARLEKVLDGLRILENTANPRGHDRDGRLACDLPGPSVPRTSE